MKITMNIYLEGFKKKINRKINVNDKIKLQDFCEFVIISMNGNCKHLYQLITDDEFAYLDPGCIVNPLYEEEVITDEILADLGLENGQELMLNYDFYMDWEIMIEIENVSEGYFDSDFEVIDGKGKGLIENLPFVYDFDELVDYQNLSEIRKELFCSMIKGYKQYIEEPFNISSINSNIRDFHYIYKEIMKPKRYEMNVSLDGFGKEIKRKILVDSNVRLDTFCRAIIVSMNGDLEHAYGLKIRKEFLDDDTIKDYDLTYLELKEKQRLKVIYDFGDNWIFNIQVSKIIDGYGPKRFMVLSGKGYGIIDDCGGAYCLSEIFNGKSENYQGYDINEFDVDQTNEIVDLTFR